MASYAIGKRVLFIMETVCKRGVGNHNLLLAMRVVALTCCIADSHRRKAIALACEPPMSHHEGHRGFEDGPAEHQLEYKYLKMTRVSRYYAERKTGKEQYVIGSQTDKIILILGVEEQRQSLIMCQKGGIGGFRSWERGTCLALRFSSSHQNILRCDGRPLRR